MAKKSADKREKNKKDSKKDSRKIDFQRKTAGVSNV
jgi:hypothetical protein